MQQNVQQNGFQLEHCRPNCPKSACNWQNLYETMVNKLNDINLIQALSQKINPIHYHHIPKISISGCPNGCSQPDIKDFGISGYVVPQITQKQCAECNACVSACLEKAIKRINREIIINWSSCISCGDCLRVCPTGTLSVGQQGWTISYGGRVGRHPQFAKLAGQVKNDEEVVSWISEALQQYIAQGHQQERLTHFLESIDLALKKNENAQSGHVSTGLISEDQKL
ncbi:4Fe-4S dicluster domain-containing protein [Desulfosporosinus sp. FKB]|uniref:4Fe-4S dicluster domain-containing protein n=1 Tax=Desulfosporosinus sp. FKB TaxID=1969835 RepID=UPI001FA920D1|nr:4Fe-4S dicluster domain-containing protein [Desulfosporosinus sp. FKB]